MMNKKQFISLWGTGIAMVLAFFVVKKPIYIMPELEAYLVTCIPILVIGGLLWLTFDDRRK